MGAAILKLDRDWKLLNADVTWTQQFDLKSVEPVQKHVNKHEWRIIREQNTIILLNLCHEWHTTIKNLRRGRWFKMAEILTLKSNYNPHQSEHLSFLLPAFESGFRRSCNGGPPKIWIISLYLWYHVYLTIIIVEFLVTVLSITYLKNIFPGWTFKRTDPKQ